MEKNNKRRKGFTIVELVIVIAVIAILAGVLIPTFSGVVNKANQSKSLQEVRNAYTETLADDLTTDGTDVVNGKNIVVNFGTYHIAISNKGVATVGEGAGTATHTVTNGKLVAVGG